MRTIIISEILSIKFFQISLPYVFKKYAHDFMKEKAKPTPKKVINWISSYLEVGKSVDFINLISEKTFHISYEKNSWRLCSPRAIVKQYQRNQETSIKLPDFVKKAEHDKKQKMEKNPAGVAPQKEVSREEKTKNLLSKLDNMFELSFLSLVGSLRIFFCFALSSFGGSLPFCASLAKSRRGET